MDIELRNLLRAGWWNHCGWRNWKHVYMYTICQHRMLTPLHAWDVLMLELWIVLVGKPHEDQVKWLSNFTKPGAKAGANSGVLTPECFGVWGLVLHAITWKHQIYRKVLWQLLISLSQGHSCCSSVPWITIRFLAHFPTLSSCSQCSPFQSHADCRRSQLLCWMKS